MAAFFCMLAGCGLAEDFRELTQGNQLLSLSAPSEAAASAKASSQEAALQPPKVLTEIKLYPTIGALDNTQRNALLEIAAKNRKMIFDFQVRYISEHEVKSTNIVLPSGHTLYQDAEGYFVFSGGQVVHLRKDLNMSLDNPNHPLYDPNGLMHDALALAGCSLYDENGVLISFENVSGFFAATERTASYNNLIVNSFFACEVLDSTSLNVPLSVFGVATLEDAVDLYENALKNQKEGEEKGVMIGSAQYVPVVDTDALKLYFNGTDGFLLDVASLSLPRKETGDETPGMIDYYAFSRTAEAVYADTLAELGLHASYDPKDIVPNKPITLYNSYTHRVEEIVPIVMDTEGRLSLSLLSLRLLFGAELTLDGETKTLHLVTDPYYNRMVQHILGQEEQEASVRYVGSGSLDVTYLKQQEQRSASTDYLFEELEATTKPGVPQPIIRTPKSGQFVYPGSNTKIWISYYKRKGEPTSLRPTVQGDWVWNDVTGFWEGVSPLSGLMVVWHPSYSAPFTIR